jgi:hypothetical protein
MKKLQNCWDFMKCGFGPEGGKAKTNGVCPAARENKLGGVHNGLHGGRACWFINHTLECGNGAHGDFNSKYSICMKCEFYWKVREEEGSGFEVSLLLNRYPDDE